MNRGIALIIGKKDYRAALSNFEAAIKLSPPSSDFFYCNLMWRGFAKELAGLHREALADCDAALKQSPCFQKRTLLRLRARIEEQLHLSASAPTEPKDTKFGGFGNSKFDKWCLPFPLDWK